MPNPHVPSEGSRRQFLRAAGAAAAVGVAGCSGGGGGGSGGSGGGSGGSGGGNGNGLGPVPDEYATATSQGGVDRNPDSLTKKSTVSYQSQPKDGSKCADCRFYIPDKNGDDLGACAIVEGKIEPSGYCTSFVKYQG